MPSVILGTAQWGAPYGMTNRHGVASDGEILEQVAIAASMGVECLDTAADYGTAESRIAALKPGLRVQTKIRVLGSDRGAVRQLVESARGRVGSALEGVLIHDWPTLDIAQRRDVGRALVACREDGLVSRVGASAYVEQDLVGIGDGSVAFEPDVLQLPVNVLDQRLEGSEVIAALRARGIRIQGRSVLLQGLIVSDGSTTSLASHPDLQHFRSVCEASGVQPLHAALSFVRSRPWVDEVVVAVSTPAELRSIADAWRAPIIELEWAEVASDDLDLIDPRRWTIGA